MDKGSSVKKNQNILIINPWEGNIGPNTFLKNLYYHKPKDINLKFSIIYPTKDKFSNEMHSMGFVLIFNRFIKLNHINNSYIKIIKRLISEFVLCYLYIKLIFKNKFDIVIVNTEMYSFSLFFLRFLCPIYVVVHSLSFKDAGAYSRFFFSIQKLFVKKFLAVSYAVKNALESVGIHNNVFVTYNGVALPAMQQRTQSTRIKILSVIHPVRHKGAHFLVDVLSKLKKENINFDWTILGWHNSSRDKQYETDVLNKINELNLSDRVKIMGNIDNIDDWYSISDLLVHPSLNESFGFAVAEAMSHSMPIIAFNVGALPELIENNKNGFLIQPYNVDNMAERIIYFHERIHLLNIYGLASREKIEKKFFVKITMNKVFKVLDII